MRAWLITWDWTSDRAAVVDRVVAILRPRLSPRRVLEQVELLHVVATATLAEQAKYAHRAKSNPYRARLDASGHIFCGGNPWLHAQLVRDLTITRDLATNRETISWQTLPVWRTGSEGPELVSPGRHDSFTRQSSGPVSHAAALGRPATNPADRFASDASQQSRRA